MYYAAFADVIVFTKFAASNILFYSRYSVSKAEKRLRAHAQWRKEYVPLGRIEEVSQTVRSPISYKMHSRIPLTFCIVQSEILPELEADKTFLQGCDKSGRPLTVCVIKKHNKSKRVLEQTKRYIAYSLDSCIHAVDLERNPTGKTCAIFDLRGDAHYYKTHKGNLPSQALSICDSDAVQVWDLMQWTDQCYRQSLTYCRTITQSGKQCTLRHHAA